MMKRVSVSDEYKIATTEVLSILEYLPQSEVDKIPNKFKEFLKENSLSDYKPSFDYSLGLDKIELKHKTKLLLAMIYKNYLCSKEEQLEYDKILCQNEESHQKYLREKYNPNNLFKKMDAQESSKIHTEKSKNAIIEYKKMELQKTSNIESPEINTNIALIEYKESFIIRFKNFIFKILHINN